MHIVLYRSQVVSPSSQPRYPIFSHDVCELSALGFMDVMCYAAEVQEGDDESPIKDPNDEADKTHECVSAADSSDHTHVPSATSRID